MAEHSKSTSKRYLAALKAQLAEHDYKREAEMRADDTLKLCQEIDGLNAEVERLKAELEKAKTQRDAMFHEIETLRGGTGRSLVDHQLAEITAAHDRLRKAGDALAALAPKEHYECEDSWYSCPASGDCANDNAGDECRCDKAGFDMAVKAWRAAAGGGE